MRSQLLPQLLLALLTLTTPASAARPDDLAETLEPLRVQAALPGLGAAVLRDGQLVAAGVVGETRADRGQPLHSDARWHLGSDTKAMTATLMGILVDRGILSWETTVGEALGPGFSGMDPGWRPVTLEQLITHTGGAPEVIPSGLMLKLYSLQERGLPSRDLLVERLLEAPPESAPGARWAYSNAGYVLAGAMAEQRTGQSWEALMQAELFTPLKMERSGFGAPTQVKDPRGHRCKRGRDRPVEATGLSDNPAALGPAGTVHASLGDWARFVALHTGDGPALLRPETMARLHTPIALDGAPPYAGGWLVIDEPARGTLTHSGSNTMWYATTWLVPDEGVAVLTVTNSGCPQAPEVLAAAGQALLAEQRVIAREIALADQRAEPLISVEQARAEYGIRQDGDALIIPRAELGALLPRELVFSPRRDDSWALLGYSTDKWPLWLALGLPTGGVLTHHDGQPLVEEADLQALAEALYSADALTLDALVLDEPTDGALYHWSLRFEGDAAESPRIGVTSNMREEALEAGLRWEDGVLHVPREALSGLLEDDPDHWHYADQGLSVCKVRSALRFLDLHHGLTVVSLGGEPMTADRLPELYDALLTADAVTLVTDDERILSLKLVGPAIEAPEGWSKTQGLVSAPDTALWLPAEIDTLEDPAPDGAEWVTVEGGLRVSRLRPGSMLSLAGLKDGDVITHYDGLPLRAAEELPALATALRLGGPVPLRIVRGEKVVEITWQRAL